MEKRSKKELIENYKNRTEIGGVYCIKCNENGRTWIKSTKNMAGQKNRFDFSVSTNSCIELSMSADWNMYGANSFSFTILEELEKGETQTDREFKEDIALLVELWIEKNQNREEV